MRVTLEKEVGAWGVEPGGQEDGGRVVDRRLRHGRLVRHGDRVQVDDAVRSLAAVLETLEYIRHETDCWLEITTLLIPDENDSESELRALSEWVLEHLGSDVPLHFTAFHPDYKLRDKPHTPHATLVRAYDIARASGPKLKASWR